VLAWHPRTGKAHLVASGFYYSDGIAVSEDGSYLLVVETDALRVVKLWLTGDKVPHSVLVCSCGTTRLPQMHAPLVADTISD
jgi:sugar lactone lactonase YvrE